MFSLGFSSCLCKTGKGWVDDSFILPSKKYLLSSPVDSEDVVMAKTSVAALKELTAWRVGADIS